jgi:general L-amino acid transport system substrate-binding protein
VDAVIAVLKLRVAWVGFVLVLTLASARACAGATLDHIRETGVLRCGINQETAEYSTSDDHGAREAFDADICKAVAVAVLGPKARTVTTEYPDDVASMEALRAGAVDLLPTLTLDLTHSAQAGIVFSRPLLYDGVGFLLPLRAKVTHADQLGEKKICFLAETEVEVALRTWFARQHLEFVAFPFQEEGEMEAAFVTGNCTALAGDLTRLAETRVAFGPLAARYTLLPDMISKDPLAAASRADDVQFAKVVGWTLEILVQAEESGLTQTNITNAKAGSDSSIEILTGRTREIGSKLGLDDAWAVRVIGAVGNYGEIYERDLGSNSLLKLPRGWNRLYTDGGLMVALPVK